MSRRRPRISECESVLDFVRAGVLRPVQPATAEGWTRYGTGREWLAAATNYTTNPALNTDTNADGFADNVTSTIANCTVTGSLTDTGLGYKVQRYSLTGGAGVGTTATIQLNAATASGTFTTGDSATSSVYARRESITGCNVYIMVQSRTAADAYIAHSQTEITATSFTRYSVTRDLAADTNTDRARIVIGVTNLHEGDTFVIEFYRAQLEKAGAVSTYFDGSISDCAWTGTANASTSTRPASNLVFTDYVTITSAGATAADGKYAYSRSSGAWRGPVVVSGAEKSATWETDVAAAWPNLGRLVRDFVAVGDLVVPLVGDSTAYVRVR